MSWELRHAFTIKLLLEVSGLARSTYYYYIKHRNDEDKYSEIKEQITTLFSQYDIKVLNITSQVNEKGTIEKIDIKTDKLRHTKKLKTAISNFYNMKESNINISE